MVTEKQKLRIIKYQSKCLEKEHKYIEHFRKNKKTYIKCKCNKCDFIDDFYCGNLTNGYIRCLNCLNIQYKNKCKELGYEYIKYEKCYIKCKCNECDFINDFHSGNMMRAQKVNICCNGCLIIKYQKKCKELGYEYIKHFQKKSTCIKCKCNECNTINDFYYTPLMNNSVKCKCEKKTFVRGFIYKLTIGPYYYIGLTDTTIDTRYSCHKKDCFYRKETTKYNSKIYKTIRNELCKITKKSIDKIIQKDFKNYVLVNQIAVINTSREDLKALETELINLNNPWCLNSIN